MIAVADVGKALEAGEEMLRTEVLKLAPFRNADPNYGHRMLAELLCEGAVDVVLLWNWDNCIERVDVSPERLEVARSWKDLEELEEQPSIAKVHGCATRKPTLLISSDDLSQQAPLWTQHALRERLRGKTAVFIGIGDVADYAQRRLVELREELAGNPEGGQDLDIWVVSPTIRDGWSDSRWAELVPDLAEERKVQLTADEFLDQLGRRWLREALEDLERLAGESLPAELEFAVEVYRERGIASPRVIDPEHDLQVDPLLVFSTSQANVVALSAFLALGWAAGEDAMPFLLLDDPLQSLDDVNALGFSDLCRHMRTRRQLIVSTHDARLASLLERKLAPRRVGERSRMLRFVAWSRSGPLIDDRDIDPQLDQGRRRALLLASR